MTLIIVTQNAQHEAICTEIMPYPLPLFLLHIQHH